MPQVTIEQAIRTGLSHQKAGRLGEAEKIYRQILTVHPKQPDSLHLLGVIAGQVGNYALAVDLIRQAIAVSPKNPDYYGNLGLFLQEQGQVDEAIAIYLQALALKPEYAEAHYNLGNAWRNKGDLDAALSSYQHALAIRPNYVEALTNLGLVWQDKGKFDTAVVYAERALKLNPDYFDALVNLGVSLWHTGQFTGAIAAYRRALTRKPDDPKTLNNLGVALLSIGQLDAAVASHQRTLLINPSHANTHYNLGVALIEAGELDAAISHYRRALELDPAMTRAHGNLLFSLYHHPASDSQSIFDESRRWNEQHARHLQALIPPHDKDRNAARRLRIGYVSPDFRAHPVGRFMLSLLASHDHGAFEIFGYAQVLAPDAMTEKLRTHCDLWRDIAGLSDENAAQLIRQDRIDILVDLALHSADNRLLVFARKPAPIQVTFAGYPGTTGLDTIDYRLTDPYLDPPGMTDSFYSEKSIRLPHTFWCDGLLDDEPPVSDLPAVANGYITFGCLNSFRKINAGTISLWSGVLNAVANSRLLLLVPEGRARQRVMDQFVANGIGGDRLEFVSKQSRLDYLRTYQRIDIGLDPSPYNGHATSMDAFWMGVPVITLVGGTVFGRGGLSQLTNLGLKELIAAGSDEYIRIAAILAADLPRLVELRSTLRDRMRNSPLMDACRFARGIEDAYRTMWRNWCDQR